MIRVRLLGPIGIDHPEGDAAAASMRSGKTMALLAYLLLTPGRVHRRAAVADLLWGDQSPTHARGSLRQALASLRRLLGPSAITADKESVTLAAINLEVDVRDFLAASRRGDMAAMLAAYGGELCAGVDVRGAHALVQWMDGERERLRRLLVSRALEAIPDRIAEGHPEDGLRWARQLYALLPDDAQVACLLFDALVASDEDREALEIIEGARAMEVRLGLPGSADVSRRMERASAARRPLPPIAATRGGWRTRLVGRERQLTALSDAVEAVRTEGPIVVTLVGVAGMGKTRLLDECESRWRLRGLRTVRLRFVPGMRDIPFAGLAEFIRGVCTLPGAIGISPASAATLCSLVADLQSVFPGVAPAPEAAPANIARALEDVLTAVAERRAVIAIVDDLHHADASTQRILSMTRVNRGVPLLLLYGARVAGIVPTDRTVSVSALDAGDVEALLRGAARLPNAPWAAAVPRVIRESTGGVPQLVDQVIRQLVEARLLTINEGEWQCGAPEALLASAAHPQVLEDGIASRSPRERIILRVLGRWRREMREDALMPILRRMVPTCSDADWQASLAALEGSALLSARDSTWQVSHDSVGDAIQRMETQVEGEEFLRVLTATWAEFGAPPLRDLEHAVRLCGELDFREGAERLASLAVLRRDWRGSGQSGRELADRLAAAAGRQEWRQGLYGSMRFLARQSRRSLLGIGAVAAMLLSMTVWSAWMLQPRLVVEVPPMGERVDYGAAVLVVQPRIAVRDGFGRSLPWVHGAVRARSVNTAIVGDSIAEVRNGRAQFTTLALGSVRDTSWFREDMVQLDFRGPWFVRPVSTSVPGAWLGVMPDGFRVTEVRVNGAILGADLEAKVAPGQSLRVDIVFEYSTSRPTANYVVGAFATWTPRDSIIRLTGLPSPVRNGWQSVSFRLPAPDEPGPAHIVVLAGAEDLVENIFSATSWTVGRPIWGDGNDVADLTLDALDRLRRTGEVDLTYVSQDYQGAQGDLRLGDDVFVRRRRERHTTTRPFEGTAVRVVVQD